MSGIYFGTDGIRDRVDGPLLQPAFVRRVGAAIGTWLAKQHPSSRCKVILGRDTRASGWEIQQQLAIGLVSSGVGVVDAGVVPTPAVSLLIRKSRAAAGIAVTASHNPSTDNGIKVFHADGGKLDDFTESALEKWIDTTPPVPDNATPIGWERVDAGAIYIDFCSALLPPGSLSGWRIVVDAAHGAGVHTTPETLRRLGAELFVCGDQPDGNNINQACGSEHPDNLCRLVRQFSAHLGIAHDGDADRLVVCDEKGDLLQGDETIFLLARHLHRQSRLARNTVVVTLMSNMGLDQSLANLGIETERVGVGDRQVLQEMARHGYTLGGESSGHLIVGDISPTGDALVAALHLIAAMRQANTPLSELRREIRLFPQKQTAIPVVRKIPIVEIPSLQEALEQIDQRLGERGRILVRYSGTEPKLRLLVEAETKELVEKTLHDLKKAVYDNMELA